MRKVQLTVSISREADELLRDKKFPSVSGFLDKLILRTLSDNAFERKQALSQFNEALTAMDRAGFLVHVDSIQEKAE
jgi:hypothetical protein